MKKIVAFDTETYPFRPGLAAPAVVCLSYDDGKNKEVVKLKEGIQLFRSWLLEKDTHIVAHHLGFDTTVMIRQDPNLIPLIMRAADEGRMHCTQIREQLINLAYGELKFKTSNTSSGSKNRRVGYSLADLAKEHLKIDLSDDKKPGSVRLRYNELADVPIERWKKDYPKFYDYALDDAIHTRKIFVIQCENKFCSAGQVVKEGVVTNEIENAKASISLSLVKAWGLSADGKRVYALESELKKKVEKARKIFLNCEVTVFDQKKNQHVKTTLCKVNKNSPVGYSVNRKAQAQMITDAYDGDPPTTDKGNVQYSASILTESGNPTLVLMGEVGIISTLLSSYIPDLKDAAKTGINPGYDVVKETNRVSSYGPNVQKMPRVGGIRGCYSARPGKILCAIDYSALELCSLAQVNLDWFGDSPMADAINAGRDLHVDFAASLTYKDYDWCMAARRGEHGPAAQKQIGEDRQLSKAGNFGLGGGMGAERFAAQALKDYGVVITEAEFWPLKKMWIQKWNMKRYFDKVKMMLGNQDTVTVQHVRGGSFRGNVQYTQISNTFFQNLAASGAKEALWRLTRAMYTDRSDPLFGSRAVAFIHDEVIFEMDPKTAHEAAYSASRHMIEGMGVKIPDVKITADPALMPRWYKEADPVFHEGRLTPWYKVGVWDNPPRRVDVEETLYPATVIVGPDNLEYAQIAKSLGYEYQKRSNLKDVISGSDHFLYSKDYELVRTYGLTSTEW